jgi:glycosyl transferase family 87
LSRPSPLLIAATIFIVVALSGGIFLVNLWFTRHQPGGQDFAVYWASARTMLQFDASPYGDLASENAQVALGRTETDASLPGFRLDLPLYAAIPVFPFAAITAFDLAQAAWMLLLEAALLATGFLCLRLLGPAPRLSFFLLPLFALFWVHAVWPLLAGNVIILATFFVVAGLVALHSGRDEAAGVFLALGTFKFLTLGIFLLLILLWALTRRRWRILFAYLMSLGILIAISYFFFPGWFSPFFQAILINLGDAQIVSTGQMISGTFPATGVRLSHILAGVTAFLLFWEWWLARGRDYRHMLWVACLTLTLTPSLGLPNNPENYAVLILPAGLVVSLFEERWGAGGRWIVAGFLALLFAGLWGIYSTARNSTVALFFPAPFVLTLALYWVRWWAIRPPRTWAETIGNAY